MKKDSVFFLSPQITSKAETYEYKFLVLRQFERIAILTQQVLLRFDRKSLLALEGSICVLQTLLAPFIVNDKEFSEKFKTIKLDKSWLNVKELRFNYFLALMDWLNCIVLKFGALGVLPSEKGEIVFGEYDEEITTELAELEKEEQTESEEEGGEVEES